MTSAHPPATDVSWLNLGRLRHYAGVIHYAFGSLPWVFFPLHRMLSRVPTQRPVEPDTDLVIEGFPRSANTFAVHAFAVAQPRPVNTADHIHVPAQIIRAARYGVPACVLVRRPEDAVRSLVVKFPFLNPRHVLRGYAGFYEDCLPYRDHFVVATFEEVTADFGKVIDRINRRFGTSFERFETNERNIRRVFRRLDDQNAAEPVHPTFGSDRPNRRKDTAKRRVQLDEHDPLLARCREVYTAYQALAADGEPAA